MLRILAILAFILPCVSAVDITGQWAATLKTSKQEFPLHIEWKQSGMDLTGAFGYRSDFLWPLSGPKLEGDKLAFKMQLPAGPELSFQGSLTSDTTISGDLISAAPGMTGRLEMTRTAPALRLPSPLAPRNARNLTSQSDEFTSPASLPSWTSLSKAEQLPDRIETATVDFSGILTILPRSAAWWAGYHGAYLFKSITGDFLVTTRLKVTGKDGGEPANPWTISGLLIRRPADLAMPAAQRKENWIYLMTGRGPKSARVVDAKSTRENVNAWDITPAESGWSELRIARIGPVFLLFCRAGNAPWTFRKLVLRPDLPETLQVGLNVTSDFNLSATMPASKYNAEIFEGKSTIDALTQVDWIRFAPVPDSVRAISGKSVLDLNGPELLRLFASETP